MISSILFPLSLICWWFQSTANAFTTPSVLAVGGLSTKKFVSNDVRILVSRRSSSSSKLKAEEDEQREYEYARLRRRRRNDYYDDNGEDSYEQEDAYGSNVVDDETTTTVKRRRNNYDVSDDDENSEDYEAEYDHDDKYEYEYDYENEDENSATFREFLDKRIFDTTLLPDEKLDSLDPYGAMGRLPDLLTDPKFIRDALILFFVGSFFGDPPDSFFDIL